MVRLMSKKTITLIGLAFFSGATLAQAGTVGNPTGTTPSGSFRIGPDLEFNERDYEYSGLDVNSVEYNRYQARVSYGIKDGMEVYIKSGIATMEDVDDDFDTGLCLGGGFKATILNDGDLKVGAFAQGVYQYNEYSASSSSRYSSVNADYDISTLELEGGVGASYQISDIIVPYAGLIYSTAEIEIEGTARYSYYYGYSYSRRRKVTLDSETNLGVFLGADFNLNEYIGIGIEARVVHESSLSILANFTL